MRNASDVIKHAGTKTNPFPPPPGLHEAPPVIIKKIILDSLLPCKSFRFGSNAMTNLLLYWTDDYGFEYNSEFNSQWVNGLGFH